MNETGRPPENESTGRRPLPPGRRILPHAQSERFGALRWLGFQLATGSFLKSWASPSKRFDRDDLSTKGPSSDSAGKHRGTRNCVGWVR